jgi:hypothetical protein
MIKRFLLIACILVPNFNVFASDLMDLLGGQEAQVEIGKDKSLTQDLRRQIGSLNAEQVILFNFLDQGQYEKAFYQWGSAFDGTKFAYEPTGRALKAYLFYKVGLEINALEMLTSIQNPGSIKKQMLNFWKEAAPLSSKSWKLSDLKWDPIWTDVFGRQAEVQVKSRTIFDANNYNQIEALLRKSGENTEERAWLEWQLALNFALNGDAAKGSKVLSLLMKEKENFIDENLMNITAARMLYENGYLDAAIKYYQTVPKNSDYWFVAQEELAWSFIRKGEPQNTLATTKSLVQPGFKALIGPETVFLRALSQLKVCDYQGAAKSLTDYKVYFRPKAKNLESLLADNKEPIEFFFNSLEKNGRLPLVKLKSKAYELPRYVTRDEVLYSLSQRAFGLKKEAVTAAELYSKSLAGGTAKVGFQADINDIKVGTDNKFQSAKNAFYNRVKLLATEEVTEINQILQKMHIVEAEILQQVTVSQDIATTDKKLFDVKKGSTGDKSQDTLRFPATDEIWFDEISNYKIDVKKGCQISKK